APHDGPVRAPPDDFGCRCPSPHCPPAPVPPRPFPALLWPRLPPAPRRSRPQSCPRRSQRGSGRRQRSIHQPSIHLQFPMNFTSLVLEKPETSYLPGSPGRHPAVHHQHLSGDIPGGGRSEKENHPLEILGTAEAAEGNVGEDLLLKPLQQSPGHFGGKPSGGDGIDVDPVTGPLD